MRKRSKRLIEETLKIPDNEWEKVYLPIPKRKRKHVKVHQSHVSLIEGKKAFRQLIIKGHGRAEPTYIISNNKKMNNTELLTIYAKRWHIEIKLAEAEKIFKQFVDMPGQIEYDRKSFTVKIRKRSTTPILLGVEKLNKDIIVPWLDYIPLKIVWTP